jgi:hypothetical protein
MVVLGEFSLIIATVAKGESLSTTNMPHSAVFVKTS